MLVEASGTAIGTGKTNTDLTVETMSSGAYTAADSNAELVQNYAANYCDLLEYEGKDDWYLPSKDELNWIYTQLYLQTKGDFTDTNYWSSSEYNDSTVWYQRFNTGEQSNQLGRGWEFYVRPVRRFKDL